MRRTAWWSAPSRFGGLLPDLLVARGVDGAGCRTTCWFGGGGARRLHRDPISEFGKARPQVKTRPQPRSWRMMATPFGIVTLSKASSLLVSSLCSCWTLDLGLQDQRRGVALPLGGTIFGAAADSGGYWWSGASTASTTVGLGGVCCGVSATDVTWWTHAGRERCLAPWWRQRQAWQGSSLRSTPWRSVVESGGGDFWSMRTRCYLWI
jgi:hypothetical protein